MKYALTMSALLATAAAGAVAPAYGATSFTGLYAGVSVGARQTTNDWTTTSLVTSTGPTVVSAPSASNHPKTSLEDTTVDGSVSVGYDWALSTSFRAGVEMEVGYGGNKATAVQIPGTAPFTFYTNDKVSAETGVDGAIRGRLGFEVAPGLLIYGTGGAAAQRTKSTISCTATFPSWCIAGARSESASKTQLGWTAGLGVEKDVGMFRLRADYHYSDFGGYDVKFAGGTVDEVNYSIDSHTQALRLGLMKAF